MRNSLRLRLTKIASTGAWTVALLVLLTGGPALADFVPIDFSAHHNYRIQARDPLYPEGSVVLGGVPFEIPVGGLNEWRHPNGSGFGGDGVITFDIPVGLQGVGTVHTLFNTDWGWPESGRLLVEFFGSDGAYHSRDLIGNDDIRAWSLFPGWTTVINGTTTTEVFRIDVGYNNTPDVMDKQEFALPADFHDETLDFIRVTDNRTTFRHGGILSGVTVETIVVPVELDLKPTSCPNPFHPGEQGLVPAAILGGPELDVTAIDVGTVQLELPAGTVTPVQWNIEDVSAPVVDPASECECTTAGPDGFPDLTLKFDAVDVEAALGPFEPGHVIELCVTGLLLDGTPFAGCDCIRITGPVSIESSSWGSVKGRYR